jgi:hypothetical protein
MHMQEEIVGGSRGATSVSTEPAAGGPTAAASATPRPAVAAPATSPAVAWAARHEMAAIVVAFALTLLYVLPILVVAAAAHQSDFFQEPTPLMEWFAAFMKSADSTLGGVHKILFPFLVTLSIIAFKDRISVWVIALAVFVLGMFMLTVWIGVLFDMKKIIDRIAAQTSVGVDVAVARAFFTKVQETLLMYLMTLLGVSVASDRSKQK